MGVIHVGLQSKKTVKVYTKKFQHSSLHYNIIPIIQDDNHPDLETMKTLSYGSGCWQVYCSNEKVNVVSKKNRMNMGMKTISKIINIM